MFPFRPRKKPVPKQAALKIVRADQPSQHLDEGDFYTNENGFMVFTAAYHLKRGYCCRNGCRHCPYGFKKSET